MYLYDRYQFISYITVGIAVFIFAFIATTLFVNTNKPVAKK
jgi:PTS system sucrose-specific IIC component